MHHKLLTSLDCARVLHHGHLDGDLVDQLVGFVVGAQVRSHLHVGLVWLLSCLDQPEGRDQLVGRKVLGRNHIFERFSLDGQVLQGVQVLELFLQQRSSDLALEIQHSKLHMAANPVLPVLLQVPVGQN